MAMDIRQTFLNHSKECPLHSTRQFIDLRTRPDANDKARALGVAVNVPTDGRTKSIDVETKRLQQIAQSADFIEDPGKRGINVIHSLTSSLVRVTLCLRLIRLRLAATRCCVVESCNSCAIRWRSFSCRLISRSESACASRSNLLRFVTSKFRPKMRLDLTTA